MAKADPRDAFIDQNLSSIKKALPQKAITDLKHFAKRAGEGRPISFTALASYIAKNHGVNMGRGRLHTIALENGVTPWWKP